MHAKLFSGCLAPDGRTTIMGSLSALALVAQALVYQVYVPM